MAYPTSLDVLRTDLTGADDSAVVDHAGLHNAVDAAVMAVQAELGLDPSGAAATVAARLAAIEADSRWTNPRTPTAHKASHATGGSDALSPADIGAATSQQGARADSAVQPTLVDAKGDLLVGGAADTLTILPAGPDNRFLSTDGSQSTGLRWATPTTRVGTGSPLGIVTPDFVGQKWVDTSRTLGAGEWVALGTTASSWVVSDGATGWSRISLVNGWTGEVNVRRRPLAVDVDIQSLTVGASTSTTFWVPPVGWAPTSGTLVSPAVMDGSATVSSPLWLALAGMRCLQTPTRTWYGAVTFPLSASVPWPTAAPV